MRHDVLGLLALICGVWLSIPIPGLAVRYDTYYLYARPTPRISAPTSCGVQSAPTQDTAIGVLFLTRSPNTQRWFNHGIKGVNGEGVAQFQLRWPGPVIVKAHAVMRRSNGSVYTSWCGTEMKLTPIGDWLEDKVRREGQ